VRENFIAAELVIDDGVITGIRGALKGGATVTERARLVIGADGKHSMVARAVDAARYRIRPPRTFGYYTYWADVPQAGGEIYSRPGCAVGAWPTGDGLVLTYQARPVAEHATFRSDVEGNFLAGLDSVGLGERIRAGQRAERFRGTPDLPNYFRKPFGPGWALVGDAGLVMDPITGQGIADAFRDAELLADAAAAGLGGSQDLTRALAGYQRARDRAARPMYDFTTQIALLAPARPAERALFEAIARSQDDADLFAGALAGAVSMREFMSPRNAIHLVGIGGFVRLAAGQIAAGR
jgi:2-polyprenyl-6-methoxyphenol hydroxylase-like FAD-dependent oxidoreductase